MNMHPDAHVELESRRAAPLRPLDAAGVEHSIFPASFGIRYEPAPGADDLAVELVWNRAGMAFRATAPVAGGDLEGLRSAIDAECAATSGQRWRVSAGGGADQARSIRFSNDSQDEDAFFHGVRAAITFAAPPVSCSAIDCVLTRRTDCVFELTLWGVEALAEGASADQPLLALEPLVESPIAFLHSVLQWMREGSDDSGFDAIARAFAEGVQRVASSPRAALAFQLTCKTLRPVAAREPEDSRNRWRLFQLIFLVSHLPALIGEPGARLGDEDVAVVYFPTGKGKTEAYLGALILLGFEKRLNGAAGGVSSWTRFPLSLLSEPLMRATIHMICAAELVRLQEPALQSQESDGFAIGLLGLGDEFGGRTPRALFDRCPACDTNTVRAGYDPLRDCAIHRCVRPGCAFPGGVLPLFSGLGAVARFLPSAVLGTADSISGPISAEDLQAVMGQVSARCPVHGYCVDHCLASGCQETLLPVDRQRMSRPSMFVPDHRRTTPVRTRGSLAHGHCI